MKLNNIFNFTFIACAGLSPAVHAFLSMSCLTAAKAMSEVPGLFITHLRRQSCDAGCQPTAQIWKHEVKDQIIQGLVDDGTQYCNAPEAKQAFSDFMNDIFDGILDKCSSHMDNKHLCYDEARLKPLADCVDQNSWTAVQRSLWRLIPYMGKEKCERAASYFTSDDLWENHFPKHVKQYVDQCHEL